MESGTKLPGLTAADYDAVNGEIEKGGRPEGLLSHAAGPIEDGWGVIDIWESREQFDTFQETRLGSIIAAQDNQPSGPPDVKQFEVHNFEVGSNVSAYQA